MLQFPYACFFQECEKLHFCVILTAKRERERGEEKKKTHKKNSNGSFAAVIT